MIDAQDLLNSESLTSTATRQALAGVAVYYPKIIDILVKIPQTVEHRDQKIELQENTFFFFTHYLQAPSTTRCIYWCYENGYYLEALILMRHLLEAFVQMRYFRKYPDKLTNHIIVKKRVTFKTMFDEFSPGYYKNYYGQQFSEAAHGIVFKYAFRGELPIREDGGNVHITNRYNERDATYIINNLTAILSGYLNRVDELLPGNQLRTNKELSVQFGSLKVWLNNALDVLEQSKVKPREVFEHFRRLFKD